MGERVRVVRHEGDLLAIKEPGDDRATAVHEEAELLARLRLPGVVEVVGVRREPPGLLTRWVGSRTLADVVVPLDPERAAALCLAVAGVLERLHRAGVVHGAVEPSHVLLDPRGRPVLCGFGGAGPIGAPVRRPATDRAAPSASRLDPAHDVAGLAGLLRHLLGPVPPRGLGRATRRRTRRWRDLTRVADLASGAEPLGRPSLAAFGRAVRRAAPDARLGPVVSTRTGPTRLAGATGSPADLPADARAPRPAAPARPARPSGAHRVKAGIPAVAALLAVAATSYLGLSAWWAGDDGGRPTGRVATDTTARTTTPPDPTDGGRSTGTGGPTDTPPTSAPATTAAPPADGRNADLAAGDASSPTEGATVVLHDGRRYAVGDPGDVVRVGPWRCDGTELVVVLRPGAGTVHLFDGWPTPSGTATARTVATVAGATDLVGVADGPGCAALVVTGTQGALATLTAGDLG